MNKIAVKSNLITIKFISNHSWGGERGRGRDSNKRVKDPVPGGSNSSESDSVTWILTGLAC